MRITGKGMQNEDDIGLVLVERTKRLVGNGYRSETGIALQGYGVWGICKGKILFFYQTDRNPIIIMFYIFAHRIKRFQGSKGSRCQG